MSTCFLDFPKIFYFIVVIWCFINYFRFYSFSFTHALTHSGNDTIIYKTEMKQQIKRG